MYGFMVVCIDGWMDGWTYGLTEGWMDGNAHENEQQALDFTGSCF